MDLFGYKSAEFSPCRKFRYSLWRWWDKSKGYVLFIGLNPSTADELKDDNTIRRCISFAKEWGFGGLCMANVFAYRATKPEDMKKADDPVGPENDEYLLNLANGAEGIVAAWGADGHFMGRAMKVMDILPPLKCLGKTKGNFPRHPLYIKGGTKLIDYEVIDEQVKY